MPTSALDDKMPQQEAMDEKMPQQEAGVAKHIESSSEAASIVTLVAQDVHTHTIADTTQAQVQKQGQGQEQSEAVPLEEEEEEEEGEGEEGEKAIESKERTPSLTLANNSFHDLAVSNQASVLSAFLSSLVTSSTHSLDSYLNALG